MLCCRGTYGRGREKRWLSFGIASAKASLRWRLGCASMRRNLTVSLDQAFIELMDAKRGSMPRSRWLEAAADANRAPIAELRSPEPPEISEPLAEPELNKHGDPLGTTYDEDDPRSWT
jgi:hypothetical protein